MSIKFSYIFILDLISNWVKMILVYRLIINMGKVYKPNVARLDATPTTQDDSFYRQKIVLQFIFNLETVKIFALFCTKYKTAIEFAYVNR